MIRTSRFLAAAVMAGLFAAGASAQDSKLKVQEGDQFPAFDLKAAQVEKIPGKKAGDTVSNDDLKGKTAVIFFYPKAMTRGCTIESCGFRDLAAKFPKDAVLIGASADTIALQQQFIEKEKLPYALLADTDLKLIQSLGIQMPGKPLPQRVTIIVDKGGKIAKIYSKVDVTKHPAEVLKFVESQK